MSDVTRARGVSPQLPASSGRAATGRGAKPQGPAFEAELKRTARDLEAVLLGQTVQSLFAGLQAGGPFGGGSAEAQWRDVMAQEYGKSMAGAGGIGLAGQIEREMRRAAGIAETDKAGPAGEGVARIGPNGPKAPSPSGLPVQPSVPARFSR